MKIGRENIPGLTQKNTAGGLRYYWEPSPAQRKAGWKTMTLPADLSAAIRDARARNEDVGSWKEGGARPKDVQPYNRKTTFGYVLACYRREVVPTMSPKTQEVDKTPLNRLETWAGDQPVAWITRPRVKALRDAMMEHATLNGPGHAPAFHLLTTLRKVLNWWIKEQSLGIPNPAQEFGLAMPAPRHQIWEIDALEAFAEAAISMGASSIDLAVEIAAYTGQREEDVITLERSRWREISLRQLGHDHRLYDALKSDHGPDAGKVMGVYVRQHKTNMWVGVPIEGALRDRIEATIAANRAAALARGVVQAQHVIVKESSGTCWGQSDFIHTFLDIRRAASAVAIMDGNIDLAERLEALQFRDLRRTCIVNLGQLGLNDYQIGSISGHTQATIKKILEVYMPRTEAAAAQSIVARIPVRSKESRNSDIGNVGT
ncbi:hypothetical protein [Sphingomonas sanguinis]|uniref:hypothetical protein n=1 Tax=Sphingomonas sanguinis TaxID=33051 RepID=UPI00077BEB7B|nr:hypothetical protein [Sphingomonas sanguinis]